MKTEINDENKGKFFAHYIDQSVTIPEYLQEDDLWKDAILTGVRNGGHEIEFQLIDKNDNVDETETVEPINAVALILKPLSSITDEDAFAVAELEGYKTTGTIEREENWVSVFTESPSGAEFSILFSNGYCGWDNGLDYSDHDTEGVSPAAYDYLRSRGYAIPWMGLSVEELKNAGWIK